MVAARPKLLNARGNANALAASVTVNGGPAAKTVALVGSQSYNYVIPIVSLPGRAGLDLNLNLYYNSRIWDVDTVGGTVAFNVDRDFPSYGFRLDFGFIENNGDFNQYILTETDGTKRALILSNGSYNSTDGSFINYNSSTKTLIYKNGTTVFYEPFYSQQNSTAPSLLRPYIIEDTNGNAIQIFYVAQKDQAIDHVRDTLGRDIYFTYNSSGQLQDIRQNVAVSTVDPSGVHVYATFHWATLYSSTYTWYSFTGLTPFSVPTAPLNVIDKCTYANQTAYQFTYGDWGIIKQIDQLSSNGTLRSSTSYNFPLASQGALSDAPAFTTQTISGQDSPTGSWLYSVTKSGTGMVTAMSITDPQGNSTTATLDSNEILSSVQLKDSSSRTLRTTGYTWKTSGGSNVPDTITTTNDAGQQSKIVNSYDSYGNVTDLAEYDFGLVLVRHTVTSYLVDDSSGASYLNKHILDLAKDVQIQDAGNSIKARTAFSYDSTGLYNTTDINANGHDNTNYGVGSTIRGNLTSVTRYLDPVTPSNGITRNFVFDSLGNLRSADVDCCNQKTFDFSGVTQWAYPDDVKRGISPQFVQSYTYNIDKGLMLTSTDENSQTTTYSYDTMNRTISVQGPANNVSGAQVTANTAYADDLASPTVTQTNTGGNSLMTVATFDGRGRNIQVDTKNKDNPATPISTVKYAYNNIGQRIQASNPFGSGETEIDTTFGYDGLGRLVTITPPSGGSTQYAFAGNSVTVTDPVGKQRKSSTDALGHLVEVDEPGTTSNGAQAVATVSINGVLRSATTTGTLPSAAPGSPLSSLVGSDGSSHTFYFGSNHHIYHLFWTSSASWQAQDLSAFADGVAEAGSSLSSALATDGTYHVFYTGSNQHVYQFVYSGTSGWVNQDLTSITGNTLAASGTSLSSFSDKAGVHTFYLGSNQHIYRLLGNSNLGWMNQDLTAITGGTLAASNSKLSSFADTNGLHVFYLGTNQHVYQLLFPLGGSFGSAYLAYAGFTDAQGWNASPGYYGSIRLADVNGDGKPDICGRSSGGIGCALNNGNGTFATGIPWESNFTDAAGWNSAPYGGTMMFADISGDGKADVCGRGGAGILCELSTGTAFGSIYTALAQFTDAQIWNTNASYYGSLRLADVNGDGKPDICGRSSGGVICGLNNGDGTFAFATSWESSYTDALGWSPTAYGSTIMFADINGDGKMDVCGRGSAGISCELSTGSGFGPMFLASSDFADAQGWNSSAYYVSLRLADVNGDGKPDLCARASGGVVCALNEGNGIFGPAKLWETAFTDASSWNLPQYGSTMMFADINGDGKADVCGRAVAGVYCESSQGTGWQNQDLTASTGNTLAASGTALTSYGMSSDNSVHLYYFGSANQHLYHLVQTTSGWSNQDLTAVSVSDSGATTTHQAASGSSLTSLVDNGGQARIYFLDAAQHVHETYPNAGSWHDNDMMNLFGWAAAGSGTALSNHGLSAGNTVHVYYLGPTQHVFDMYLSSGGTWSDRDVFSITNLVQADSGVVSLTVGSFTATACYGSSSNPSCSSSPINALAGDVASALSQALNAQASPVTATASGTNITLTWKSAGLPTIQVSALSSTPDNTTLFPNGSFNSAGASFAWTQLTGSDVLITRYTYDVLDNLVAVNQAASLVNGQLTGGQPRSYSYDPLGRLISVTTPESGTVINHYNVGTGTQLCSGDLRLVCWSQDAAGIQKTFTYDGINRLSSVQFSDGTPTQSYQYDAGGSAAYSLDRLTKIIDGTNSQTFTYDSWGLTRSVSHLIDGNTYIVQYGYNATGQTSSITYPTNRVVNQNYDSIGRLASIADGSTIYINNVTYNAAAQPTAFTYGNLDQGSYSYNDHLQISGIRYTHPGNNTDILNLGYDYGVANNGQIQAIRYYTSPGAEDATKSEYFSYDGSMRLNAAHTGIFNSFAAGTWSIAWIYDRFGNRVQQTVVGGNTSGTSIGQFQVSIDPATNHIVSTGLSYDANGNITNDGSNTYRYDAQHRIVQVNGGAAIYTYFNQLRIKKSVGSGTTTYIYSGTKAIAEYSNGNVSREYIYSGSQILAEIASGTVIYHHPDHLSNRANTDSSGNVVLQSGHAPFGENWYGGSIQWKFTSYERNNESGIDYAQFRYYGFSSGRFMSADPLGLAGSTIEDPQSLNLYSYVSNDPVNLTDPLGLYQCTKDAATGITHCSFGLIWPPPAPQYIPDPNATPNWGGGFTSTFGGAGGVLGGLRAPLLDEPPDRGKQIGLCFLKGAAVGVVTAVAIGLVATAAVTAGIVSAPVASGALLISGAVGGAIALYHGYTQARSGNWAGAAYSAGSIAGGLAGGSIVGGTVGDAINPPATRGFWSIGRDWANRYRPSLGSIGNWLGTGPDAAAAAGALGLAGAGSIGAVKDGC